MVISIGIDPSLTGTGMVVLKDGELYTARTVKNKPDLPIIQRVSDIYCNVLNVANIQKYTPGKDKIILAIEGFSYGSKGRAVFETGYLGWRIREELVEASSVPYIDVPPTALKKFATGKGNCGKDLILQQVYKRWGIELSDNNQADAYVLAQIARAHLDKTVVLTTFQAEVMKVLGKEG
jgi:crossover junction endodeoxyribonuclease RuvC